MFHNRNTPPLCRKLSAYLLALLIGLGAVSPYTGAVSASPDQYEIYPGLDDNGRGTLTEYGLHYDELSFDSYGARDFNHPDDAGAPVFFRIRVLQQQSNLGVRLSPLGECGVRAQVGRISGSGEFAPFPGQSFHYLHITVDDRIVEGVVEDVDGSSERIQAIPLGRVAADGSGCDMGGAHLHQSADLEPGAGVFATPREREQLESCWSSAEPESWQCGQESVPGGGTYSRSGTIYDYIYQSWSEQPWSSQAPLYLVRSEPLEQGGYSVEDGTQPVEALAEGELLVPRMQLWEVIHHSLDTNNEQRDPLTSEPHWPAIPITAR